MFSLEFLGRKTFNCGYKAHMLSARNCNLYGGVTWRVIFQFT